MTVPTWAWAWAVIASALAAVAAMSLQTPAVGQRPVPARRAGARGTGPGIARGSRPR